MSNRAHNSSTQQRKQGRRRAVTILMVDDYEDNRRMMKKLLELNGYVVLEADNGVDAVKLTQQEQPSLVIMDLGLPLLDGMEATRLIRQIPETSSIPIIALSAYDAASVRNDAIASGCNSYLTKPVDYDRLEETIRTLLTRTRENSARTIIV